MAYLAPIIPAIACCAVARRVASPGFVVTARADRVAAGGKGDRGYTKKDAAHALSREESKTHANRCPR
jgi:hypothetical protein